MQLLRVWQNRLWVLETMTKWWNAPPSYIQGRPFDGFPNLSLKPSNKSKTKNNCPVSAKRFEMFFTFVSWQSNPNNNFWDYSKHVHRGKKQPSLIPLLILVFCFLLLEKKLLLWKWMKKKRANLFIITVFHCVDWKSEKACLTSYHHLLVKRRFLVEASEKVCLRQDRKVTRKSLAWTTLFPEVFLTTNRDSLLKTKDRKGLFSLFPRLDCEKAEWRICCLQKVFWNTPLEIAPQSKRRMSDTETKWTRFWKKVPLNSFSESRW